MSFNSKISYYDTHYYSNPVLTVSTCSRLLVPCSMQIDSLDIPWILQEVAFRIPVFGRKVSLIFLFIYQLSCQWVWVNLTQLSLWSFPTIPLMTQLSSFNWFRMSLVLKVSNSLSSLIDFTEIRPVLACIDCLNIQIRNYIDISIWSCLNQSTWWLCMRHTRSTTPS